MTKSNISGVVRVLLSPIVAWVLLSDLEHKRLWSLAIIILAIISDVLDGYWARKEGIDSAWGVFLDETADKIFLTCVLVPLGLQAAIAKWMLLAIICGWFLISGFRSYAASAGVTVRPNLFSKMATILIFPGILLAVLGVPLAFWLFTLGIVWGILSFIFIAFFHPESRALLARGLFQRQACPRRSQLGQ